MARSHAMLGVEIGVALTVMCSMYGIYVNYPPMDDLIRVYNDGLYIYEL